MTDKIRITVSEHAGFCPGVKGVLKKIDHALSEEKQPVYTFGKAIHNPGVIKKYEDRGVRVINSATEAPDGSTVIIRAHGLPRTDIAELESGNITVVDGTCPKVKKVHRTITEAAESGRNIIIAGYDGHAETMAHISLFPEKTALIESVDDLDSMSPSGPPVTLIAQTTFDPAEYERIMKALKKKLKVDLDIMDTICPCTLDAQIDASEIAARVEAMIVIGGRESANTQRLAECCGKHCTNVFHVESAGELDTEKISQFKSIGITAGASTPIEDIESVIESIEKLI